MFFLKKKTQYWIELSYRIEFFYGEFTSTHKTLNAGSEQGSLLSGTVSDSNGINL